MQFRLLGPVSVHVGERDITPSAPKQRQVLTMLLSKGGRRVSVHTLLSEVWDDDPPRTATTALQTYIGAIRKAMAAASDCSVRTIAMNRLVTDGNGYVLRVDDTESDRPEFEALVRAGRALLADGDPQSAITRLEEALHLWRGRPFCNVRQGRHLRPQARVLNETHLTACELRIDALLGTGRPREAVSEAMELIDEHPYHENLYAQFMRGLYDSGRRAAALNVYTSLCRRMSEDLGLLPSPATRTLHHVMLQENPDSRYLAASGAMH